jgi:hypothetical protein
MTLQFRCPHCQNILRVRPEYLGRAGKCNRCSGRIALLGENDRSRVQAASVLDEAPIEPNAPPATERQKDYLRDLGVDAAEVEQVDRSSASTLIQKRRDDLAAEEPPTEAQLTLLARLGLHDGELALVRSKSYASQLIDQLQPRPTQHQLYYLRRLGVPEADIAAISSRSEASDLIEQWLRHEGRGET